MCPHKNYCVLTTRTGDGVLYDAANPDVAE